MTHIAGLVVLEIADGELAVEAVIVLLGELIVPRCSAAVCICVIAKESEWRLSLCIGTYGQLLPVRCL